MKNEQLITRAWRISTGAAILAACLAVGLAGAHAPAAVVSLTTDVFDADSDIATAGTLVEAYNLGWGTGVTANGVFFAPDPGNSAFMAVNGTNYDHGTLYGGGAIGSTSFTDTHLLLDTVEYGPGVGNSLARVNGLTVGQDYLVQVLIVDDRAGNENVTVDFGYATPSGNPTETYTQTGLDHTASNPLIVTGTFTADETSQDLHIRYSNADNGMAQGYQLRALAPPPPVSQIYENTSHKMTGGDFFGDGQTDVAYVRGDGTIFVHDFGGANSQVVALPGGETAVELVAADLNGDGRKGLAIITSAATGLRTYDFVTQTFTGPHGNGLVDISAANIDADPRDEVMGVTGGYVGLFESGAWGADLGDAITVNAGDFNADATQEFMVTVGTNLWYYDGETGWTQYALGSGMTGLTVGNVETADATDEVLVHTTANSYYYNDNGTFTATGSGKAPMDAGRVDGDMLGGQDFMYVLGGDNVIYQSNNWDAAPGNFWLSVRVDASTSSGVATGNAAWSDFLVADIDGDGLDEIIGRRIADPDALYLFNNGDVGFALTEPQAVVIPEPMTMLAVGLSIAGLGGYIRRRKRC